MPFVSRPDGVRVEDAPSVRRFMPFLMRRRNESLVWFEHDVEVDRALSFAEAYGREHGVRVTLFVVILHALARVLSEFPRLNRYVVGRRLYQRRDVAISFSGKEAFDDRAPIYVRKRVFDPRESLAEAARSISSAVGEGRRGRRTGADVEVSVLLRLPRPLIDLAISAARLLDYFNLLPARMIREDPLYASAFVANLGSVGIAGAYHHLYEHGTIPVFVVVGAYRPAPVVTAAGAVEVRRVATFKYTYDERIEDGFYCAAALARFKELLEHPEELARA